LHGAGNETVAVGALQWNTWQQIAITWSKQSQQATIYVDGTLLICL
jgi:hypothetical protein